MAASAIDGIHFHPCGAWGCDVERTRRCCHLDLRLRGTYFFESRLFAAESYYHLIARFAQGDIDVAPFLRRFKNDITIGSNAELLIALESEITTI